MATAARVPVKPAAPRPVSTAVAKSGGTSAPAGGFAANWQEFAVPIAVLSIVLAMITPLPPFLLDILISANITLSVIVLLVGLYITKPVEFNVFPSTLL